MNMRNAGYSQAFACMKGKYRLPRPPMINTEGLAEPVVGFGPALAMLSVWGWKEERKGILRCIDCNDGLGGKDRMRQRLGNE